MISRPLARARWRETKGQKKIRDNLGYGVLIKWPPGATIGASHQLGRCVRKQEHVVGHVACEYLTFVRLSLLNILINSFKKIVVVYFASVSLGKCEKEGLLSSYAQSMHYCSVLFHSFNSDIIPLLLLSVIVTHFHFLKILII